MSVEGAAGGSRDRLAKDDQGEQLVAPGDAVSWCHEVPRHEDTDPGLRDDLRARAGVGWHLLADADGFHSCPVPLPEIPAQAEASGTRTVGGLMLDRVRHGGGPAGWAPENGLDAE